MKTHGHVNTFLLPSDPFFETPVFQETSSGPSRLREPLEPLEPLAEPRTLGNNESSAGIDG